MACKVELGTRQAPGLEFLDIGYFLHMDVLITFLYPAKHAALILMVYVQSTCTFAN
jgi:hypothetical protein